MKRRLAVLIVGMLMLFPLSAHAAKPLETVEENVNKVLAVLRDPALKGDAGKERKKARLRNIYKVMFDDVELSRRTLARHWNSFDLKQRREFVGLFQRILEKAYIDKILEYTNEKIVFVKETPLTDRLAEVQSLIVTSSKEIPISYRAILKDGTWKVYDVIVENVSLVLNYRTQFNDILMSNTPDELLKILDKKVREQEG